MIRITDSKLARYGVNGLSLAVPPFFHEPRNLNPKDKLPTYITKINNIDCMIIATKELPELSDNNINTNQSKVL